MDPYMLIWPVVIQIHELWSYLYLLFLVVSAVRTRYFAYLVSSLDRYMGAVTGISVKIGSVRQIQCWGETSKWDWGDHGHPCHDCLHFIVWLILFVEWRLKKKHGFLTFGSNSCCLIPRLKMVIWKWRSGVLFSGLSEAWNYTLEAARIGA